MYRFNSLIPQKQPRRLTIINKVRDEVINGTGDYGKRETDL